MFRTISEVPQNIDIKHGFEKSRNIFVPPVTIAPSKVFTYPTRLADAWEANVLQIDLPERYKDSYEVELSVCSESTRSLGIAPRNLYDKLYKQFTQPINRGDEHIYDARYSTDGNIAHILTIVVPVLLLAKSMCPDMTVLLRANATTMAKTIYRLLGFSVLCSDNEVYGKLLIAPNGRQHFYEGLYSSLFKDLEFAASDTQMPERVFISRRGTRCLTNEDDIEQTLNKYGFKKVYFEDISISEQWAIARNAKVVVGLHGAALSNLVFNQHSVKVVELFHPGYVVDMYRRLTNVIGGSWCGVTGQFPEDIIRRLDVEGDGRRFALSPTKIDLTSLKMALSYLDVEPN